MYSGSSYDSGQMDNGQLTYQPAVGPTASWLEAGSSHRYQQQQQKEDGQPVAVRVMTNGTSAPSERSDNYVQPFAGSQPEPPTSPSHLAFLYDRAQQPQPVKSPSTGSAVFANGYTGMTSPPPPPPPSDGYRSLSRAVPAPVHHRQQQQPALTAARTSTDGSSEYNPLSRATPAPIQQHAAQHPTTTSSDIGTPPTSPPTTQHGTSQPPAAQVTRQLSQLAVADGQQQQSPRSTVVVGSGPAGSHRAGRVARQPPPPSAFTRRLSAPGPTGQVAGEPGSRKPWSYTPSFGVGCGTGRVAPRPIVHRPSQNGMNTPRIGTAEGVQPKSPATDAPMRGDVVDGASIRYKLREGEDPIVDYDETSIRYRGRANPSKTFRLLQSATGSDSDSDSVQAYATSGRRRRRQPSKEVTDEQPQQPHADDIVDISYVGANIPSRTFRILQEAVGVTAPQNQENDGAQSGDFNSDGVSPGSRRNVRVIHLRPMKKHSSVDNILAYTDL